MAALGLFFVILPGFAILSFTCFAACRAQRRKVFKVLAHGFLTVGLVAALTSAGVGVWLFTL
ncbi:hypothetical protein [Streptomyces sp. NPDC005322]|uniref:hypothetical protein n=1 Tax=unclassified Streptomyces TaxID=2593676 RepID=UPI0033A27375